MLNVYLKLISFRIIAIVSLALILFDFRIDGLHAGKTIHVTEFICKGERIEKRGSTWGYARSIASGFRIEKDSGTIGWVKKAGSYWRIESLAGSTIGWFRDSRIETPGGSTWMKLSDIEKLADCPVPITSGLWVLLQKMGT